MFEELGTYDPLIPETDGRVQLEWLYSTEPDVAGYHVERGLFRADRVAGARAPAA